jgi:hypothetical protein
LVSFSRHGEIYRSDVERKGREGQSYPLPALIGVDESPVGYSLAGCSPAVPVSASPTGEECDKVVLSVNRYGDNGNIADPVNFNRLPEPLAA